VTLGFFANARIFFQSPPNPEQDSFGGCFCDGFTELVGNQVQRRSIAVTCPHQPCYTGFGSTGHASEPSWAFCVDVDFWPDYLGAFGTELEDEDSFGDGTLYIGIGIKGFLGKLRHLLVQLGESLFEIDEDSRIGETDVLDGVGIGSADPDI